MTHRNLIVVSCSADALAVALMMREC